MQQKNYLRVRFRVRVRGVNMGSWQGKGRSLGGMGGVHGIFKNPSTSEKINWFDKFNLLVG